MTSPTPEPGQSTEAARERERRLSYDAAVAAVAFGEAHPDDDELDLSSYTQGYRDALVAARPEPPVEGPCECGHAASQHEVVDDRDGCNACEQYHPFKPVEPPVEGALEEARDGASRIAAERLRQVTVEGWTPEHDQDHDYDQLAWAAISYATPEGSRVMESRYIDTLSAEGDHVQVAHDWPWPPEWWKPVPDDRARELVKAGALIAAEIDRLTGESPLAAARSGHDGLRRALAFAQSAARSNEPWSEADYAMVARALSPDPGPVEPGGAA